jgi:hypothetical protein
MARLVALTLLLAFAGCKSVPTQPQPVQSLPRSGEAMQVAVGGRMVDETSTSLTVAPMVNVTRTKGFRTEIVYLGLLGTDPAGLRTVRVRYEEHAIADGVENARPEYRAEVTLDLGQGQVIDFRGWRIRVLEGTPSSIRYEVIGSPAP